MMNSNYLRLCAAQLYGRVSRALFAQCRPSQDSQITLVMHDDDRFTLFFLRERQPISDEDAQAVSQAFGLTDIDPVATMRTEDHPGGIHINVYYLTWKWQSHPAR